MQKPAALFYAENNSWKEEHLREEQDKFKIIGESKKIKSNVRFFILT